MAEQPRLSALEPMLHQLLFAAKPTSVDGIEPEAQAIYRRLVRATLFRVVKNAIPITLGVLGDARTTDLLTAWLDAAPPTTRILREVPEEFAAWLAAQAGLEPGLSELVHFEVLEIAVSHGPDAAQDEVSASPTPHPTCGVLSHPCTRLAVYEHPVFTLTREATHFPPKTATPSFLLAYRAAERMHWVTLPRDVAMVLFRTAQGQSLAEACDDLGAAGREVDAAFLRSWLVNLRHRGALLGFPNLSPKEST